MTIAEQNTAGKAFANILNVYSDLRIGERNREGSDDNGLCYYSTHSCDFGCDLSWKKEEK